MSKSLVLPELKHLSCHMGTSSNVYVVSLFFNEHILGLNLNRLANTSSVNSYSLFTHSTRLINILIEWKNE